MILIDMIFLIICYVEIVEKDILLLRDLYSNFLIVKKLNSEYHFYKILIKLIFIFNINY